VNDEKKRKGANEESSPFNLRMPHKTRAKLDAVAAQLPILSTHRVAVAALDIGLAALAADPSLILRIDAHTKPVEAAPVPAETPLVVSPSMPPRRATLPPARASVRPPLPSMPPPPRIPAELVETEAARVDPRQLALIPEPPVDLDGMTVRETPLETVAEVRARLLALRAADPKAWSYRKVAALAHMSPEPIASVVNGENVRPETLARIAAILPREHMEKTSS